MNTSPRSRQAFTLVELLVVITIIGILAGLITGAAIMARGAAKRAVIRTEIVQLEMALEKYKAEYGEYPPDFFGLQFDPTSNMHREARQAVLRHLRKRFPRWLNPDPDVAWGQFEDALSTNYGIVANKLDPASALVFWLGGLPDGVSGNMTPAGFHKDPTAPCKHGLPRTKPLFEFNLARYVPVEENPADGSSRYLRFYPAGSYVTGNQSTKQAVRDEQAPYAYFKSRRIPAANNRYEYACTDDSDVTKAKIIPAYYAHQPTPSKSTENIAVPYLDGPPTSNTVADLQARTTIRRWRNLEKYQIICAGLDGHFGNVDEDAATAVDLYRFRSSRSGNNLSEGGQDFDNLTNFTEGTLEDEML